MSVDYQAIPSSGDQPSARTGVGRSPKLRIEDISKTFVLKTRAQKQVRQIPVLRHVSFDGFDTEIISLIGQSGSGKTTLLRIIQGLLRADAGQVLIDDRVVHGPGYDRGIVFQQANLLPWRDAQNNVEFGLELKGISTRERAEKARQALDLVGLSQATHQYPHQLSGGMQQRVGLARALVVDPEILLMDEPFSALDAQTREILQQELLRIHLQTNKTILFVTHDLDEAVYLSDRIVVLRGSPGRIGDVVTVPFERPRPELALLRADARFVELRTQLWQLIRAADSTAEVVR
jgi:NitT/TauT family transport system ATP-binding protein